MFEKHNVTVATTELFGILTQMPKRYACHNAQLTSTVMCLRSCIIYIASCVNLCPFVTVSYKCMYFKTGHLLRTFGTSNYSNKNIQCTRL